MKTLVCMLSVLLVINPLIHCGSDDSAYLPLSNPLMTDAVIVPRSCCRWNMPRPAGAAKDFMQTAGQRHGEQGTQDAGAVVFCRAKSKGRVDRWRAVGKAGDES